MLLSFPSCDMLSPKSAVDIWNIHYAAVFANIININIPNYYVRLIEVQNDVI